MGVSEPLIQQTLLGEAVEHGPAAVFVADENGRYVAVNQAACELLGYSREELLGLRVDEVSPGAVNWDEMLKTGSVTGTAELRRKDGSALQFSYVAGATVVAGMSVFVSVGAAA